MANSALNTELFQRLCYEQTLHATTEIISLLEQRGIPSVALKGPILAERIYPNPSRRTSCDIDLLVCRRDLESASRTLEALGFSLFLEGLTLAEHRRLEFHSVFQRAGSPPVELHFRLTDMPGPHFEAAAFIERSWKFETSRGARVRVLRPEDEFLFLCVHGSRHCFEEPKWLLDLKLFALAYPDLSWDDVAARAQALGIETAAWVALSTLKRDLDFEIPGGKVRVSPNLCMRRLWPWLSPAPPASIRGALYLAMLFDSLPAACWYLLKRASRIARRRGILPPVFRTSSFPQVDDNLEPRLTIFPQPRADR